MLHVHGGSTLRATKLVHRHSTKIMWKQHFTSCLTQLKTATNRRQPLDYLQSVVELIEDHSRKFLPVIWVRFEPRPTPWKPNLLTGTKCQTTCIFSTQLIPSFSNELDSGWQPFLTFIDPINKWEATNRFSFLCLCASYYKQQRISHTIFPEIIVRTSDESTPYPVFYLPVTCLVTELHL